MKGSAVRIRASALRNARNGGRALAGLGTASRDALGAVLTVVAIVLAPLLATIAVIGAVTLSRDDRRLEAVASACLAPLAFAVWPWVRGRLGAAAWVVLVAGVVVIAIAAKPS